MKGLIKRNFIEMIRDPLTLILGIVFPVILLLTFLSINLSTDLPFDLFSVNYIVSGITVFGFCMLMMLVATIIIRDRQSSLFARFQTLPLRSVDFIIGYMLPCLPIAILQMLLIFLIGIPFGLNMCWGTLLSMLVLLPIAIMFIAIGIILGITCNETQLSGFGTLLINVCTLLSGAWFDLKGIGGVFSMVGYALPFAHGVDAGRELIMQSSFDYVHLIYISGYALIFTLIAIVFFYYKLKGRSIDRHFKKIRES